MWTRPSAALVGPATIVLLVLASPSLRSGAAAQESTVLNVTVKPAETQAGTSVTATAGGSGLCGAVHIDWGDGTAITYATATLPVAQSHVYKNGGTFTVRAQGMGNCAGQATTQVKVAGPPPPPPGAKLIAVDLSPAAIAPRTAVTITLRGEGACRVNVDFGDGNSQELSGGLPLTVRHTYALAGKYAIVATPTPPCGDRRSATLTVGDVPKGPHISGIEINTPEGAESGMRAIRVTGAGRCAYTLEFGDGNSEGRNADLPDVVRHNYPASGRYTVVASAAAPCTGKAQSTILVGNGRGAGDDRSGRLVRLTVRPRTAGLGEAVEVTLIGSGRCRVTLAFGDGGEREVAEELPYRLAYRYAATGNYEVAARAHPPCSGNASAGLRVRER